MNYFCSVHDDEKFKDVVNCFIKVNSTLKKLNFQIPLLVSLTAGTTVLGAFDPFNPVANICEKYKIWLHVVFIEN